MDPTAATLHARRGLDPLAIYPTAYADDTVPVIRALGRALRRLWRRRTRR